MDSTPIYRRNLLVAVFFLVNLCLGVVGTFWLQTRTRREEVGVMLSFGATPGRIVRLLLGEGAVLTTLGTLVGCFIYLQYAISEGLSRGVSYYEGLPPEYWTDFFWAHFLIVSLFVYAILLVVVSTGVRCLHPRKENQPHPAHRGPARRVGGHRKRTGCPISDTPADG